MAAINTGMTKAEMKKLLIRSKEEPVNCAVGQGEVASVGLLMLHRTKSGKAMEKVLKDEFPDVKNPRFGSAFVDVDENPKLVKFQLNRAVSGMARRLIKTLKGTGFTKVIILTEDGSVAEDFEEDDEEAEEGVAAAPAGPQAAGVPPPPPPAPPAGKSPEQIKAETAELAKQLATMAPLIPRVAGDDADRKASLMKLATDANVNLKTGNLVYAANFIEQLKRALQGSGAASLSTGPAPAVSLQDLQASRSQWEGVQNKIRAEVDKLRAELSKTYQGQSFAAEIIAKFQEKVGPVTERFDDRMLDVLDDLMNTAEAAKREALIGQARGLIKDYIGFAKDDPLLGDLDDNPFVKLSIRPTVTTTLANLAKTLH